MTSTKRRRRRLSKRTMPEPIPDTPENVARALVTSPPKAKGEWRYLRDTDGDKLSVWLLQG